MDKTHTHYNGDMREESTSIALSEEFDERKAMEGPKGGHNHPPLSKGVDNMLSYLTVKNLK